MNVIAGCGADRKLQFVDWGGEGCAHDYTLLKEVTAYKNWPKGTFMLFDAAAPCEIDRVLSPYRGVTYHLRELKQPKDKRELFNMRHSVKRSGAIECAFGIWKQRCAILRRGIKARKERVDLIMQVSMA